MKIYGEGESLLRPRFWRLVDLSMNSTHILYIDINAYVKQFPEQIDIIETYWKDNDNIKLYVNASIYESTIRQNNLYNEQIHVFNEYNFFCSCFIFEAFHYAYKQIFILKFNNVNTHTYALSMFALFYWYYSLLALSMQLGFFSKNVYQKTHVYPVESRN